MGDGQGSLVSLLARGPQDSFMTGDEGLMPEHRQYTDFSIDQQTYTFGTAPYLGTRQVFSLTPKQIPGDLLIGAYLKVKMPSANYMDQLGRGLTKRVSMQLDAVEVETLYDDGYVIRDQLTLTADEQSLMSNIMNGTSLYIPLEFSWCRRGKPFPICAAWNQTMYIFFDFAAMYEVSDATAGDLLSPPQLVLETVTLTDTERNSFRSGHTMEVHCMYREPLYFVNNQLTNVNMTANFNVTHMTWFLRKKLNLGDPTYYLKRFDFTYDTTTNVALVNLDIFEYIYIFINNQNITSRFPGKLFYRYLQPMLNGYNTPNKDIYMYGFGQGLNFSRVDSNTSTLNIKFLSQYVQDVILNYTLNLYYFGTQKISFSGGYCSLIGV